MADTPVKVSTQDGARRKGTLSMLANPRGLWRFLVDRRASKLSKVAAILAVIYVLSPVDLLPDYLIPLVGFLDDLGFTAVALAFIASQASRYENAKLEAGENAKLEGEKAEETEAEGA